jgi:hypothetical protein
MKFNLILFFLQFLNAYEFIDTCFVSKHKDYYINERETTLIEVSNEVIKNINSLNFYELNLIKNDSLNFGLNNKSTITYYRTNNNFQYGYTTIFNVSNDTDIYINEKLIQTPNVLYNVLLHEFLHSLCLDHTYIPSVMNYTVSLDSNYNIINERNKIYLSVDDFKGLKKLYNQISLDTKCNKQKLINCINKCY